MKVKVLILVLGLACSFGFGECGQRIDIILSGRDIAKFDTWSESDPYLKVFYKFDDNQNWISYGQTFPSQDNPNPNWPEVFTFDYVGGNAQRVKYEVWDEDVIWDEIIGDLELPIGEIVASANEHGGMAVERHVAPATKSGRLLMKVRIDGIIPMEEHVKEKV